MIMKLRRFVLIATIVWCCESHRRDLTTLTRKSRNSRLMTWKTLQHDANPISIIEKPATDLKKSINRHGSFKEGYNFNKHINSVHGVRTSKEIEEREEILNNIQNLNNLRFASNMNTSRGSSQEDLLDNKALNGPDEGVNNEKFPTYLSPNSRVKNKPATVSDDNVCVKKVMQVSETVYEKKLVCHHKMSKKCHNTFLTEYVPTMEKKCMTSYQKKCNIEYKPVVHTETVRVCREPLQKVCNNNTVGEVVCRTYYETECHTRYKEREVEEDKPVCKIVTEKKCENNHGFHKQRKRRQHVLNADVNCEEWPVKKCTLEKTLVTKVHPESSCKKISRRICAPSNCVMKKAEKEQCKDEDHNSVLSIPSESCDLHPTEDCNMETVLVPRLVQKPRCVNVPREVCVTTKGNPKKVLKPVIKEWCYKPSEPHDFYRRNQL